MRSASTRSTREGLDSGLYKSFYIAVNFSLSRRSIFKMFGPALLDAAAVTGGVWCSGRSREASSLFNLTRT